MGKARQDRIPGWKGVTSQRGSIQTDRATLSPTRATTEDIKLKMTHAGLVFTDSKLDAPQSQHAINVLLNRQQAEATTSSSDKAIGDSPSKITPLRTKTSKAHPTSSFLSRRVAASSDLRNVSPHVLNLPDLMVEPPAGSPEKEARPTRSLPTSPLLQAHSIQIPAMSLEGPSAAAREQQEN